MKRKKREKEKLTGKKQTPVRKHNLYETQKKAKSFIEKRRRRLN